ncbi:MAG: N-acetylmuramoyl-L-alanine amidase [Chitinophagaceae bacterium]
MNFTSLNTLEETVFKTGNNGEYEFRKFSIPVKDASLTLRGLFTTPKNRSKYYQAVEHPKQRIVLHFTAGHIRSDLGALTRNDYRVSVPFLIGRTGLIYQLFPSKFWSGHIGLGIGNTNTGNAQDKVTIGIELSNYGYLTEKNGNLETYYSRQKDKNGNPGAADIYCSLADTAAYKKIETPFRQQSYYATCTDAQYDSLIILLRYLTGQFSIPRQFLPEPKRYEATQDVLTFKGIVSHVNYRVNGKWDIGPGFDWTRMINGVQAAAYTSLFDNFENAGLDEGLENTGEVISSEDQFLPYLPEAEDPSLEGEEYEELF